MDLPTLKPVASLEPTKSGKAGVAMDTAFRLKSLDGSSPTALVARLEVQPRLQLQSKVVAGNAVLLTPSTRLSAGQLYQFTLRRADGTIAQTWSAKAATTLQVVGTLPDNESTDVPRNTGIEITFDQPGVTLASVRRAFSITPKVSGRFEMHGKVVAFVPAKPLKALTVYTVRLRKGVPLPGTGQSLAADVRFRFETRPAKAIPAELYLEDRLVDAATTDKPTIEVWYGVRDDEGDTPLPARLPVTVHRFDGITAAIAAYRRLADAPEWAHSGGAPIKTSDLTLVMDASLPLRSFTDDDGDVDQIQWVQLPQPLAAGWYVLTFAIAGPHQQAIIQVTDLAAYAKVTDTRSAIWVNSLRTGTAVAGATIRIDGAALGTTDHDGLRIATTPASVPKAMPTPVLPVMTVTDLQHRAVFVPLADQQMCYACDTGWDEYPGQAGATDAWWHVLSTDRTMYRATDTAKVWGVIRDRANGSVPSDVELLFGLYYWGDGSTPIVTRTVHPDANGMFTGTLALEDLPPDLYGVEMRVNGQIIGGTSVSVGRIVKPAWSITLTTNKQAVVTGKPVTATAQATFFDGTPVAGVELRIGFGDQGDGSSDAVTVKTGLDGRARAVLTPRIDGYQQSEWESIMAVPVLPEEADLSAETSITVFASTAVLSVDGALASGRLTVSGHVSDVDFARIDADQSGYWDGDPSGAPRADARVSVTTIEVTQTRTKIGTTYDFITKTTSPVYRYGERTRQIDHRMVRTRADGTFRFGLDVGGGDHDYRITAHYTDEAHRTINADVEGVGPMIVDEPDSPSLVATGPKADMEELEYSVGESVQLTVEGGYPAPAIDRYLFTVSSQGLRAATVQAGPDYRTPFAASWVPNAQVDAVRFNGKTYEPVLSPVEVSLQTADRALAVTVTSDSTRYAPGGKVSLAVRVRGPDGRPAAASVVVRAIDAKLYEIEAASETSILDDLYRSVSTGVLVTTWSHRGPNDGGGGDTAGGGGDGDNVVRSDFQDQILFEKVTTGSDGRASVTFALSDDLTTWVVSADAIDRTNRAGGTTLDVPVGLPFFVESAVASDYLVGDQPVLRVRSYGTALRPSDTVTFQVSAPSIGLAPTTAKAAAFEAVTIPLPKLRSVGDVAVQISGTTGFGSSQYRDAVVRTLHVIDTRSVQGRTSSGTLTSGYRLPSGTGLTSVVLSDGGRGQSLPVLLELIDPETSRADAAIAALIARAALIDTFGMPAADVGGTIDLYPFQSDSGIRLLPYASEDLELSALAGFARDNGIDPGALNAYLSTIWSNESGRQTRERRIVALAGLAALGEPVLDEIRVLAKTASKLPIDQRTWLALAALGAGDEVLAAKLERAILADAGQRLGPWVRVKMRTAELTATTTARLAVVAAGLGDRLAADMDAYVEANPPKDTLVVLERALAARAWAERMPGTSAAATVTTAGITRQISIDPMEPVWLRFTPGQLATTTLNPVSGTAMVTARWEGPLDVTSLHRTGVTTFTRTVTPAGTVGLADVVVVKFTVKLSSSADDGCWQVTDLVPSGLVPISPWQSWYDDEDTSPGIDGPWRVEGQRVDFCVSPDTRHPTQQMRYVARVTTPGTYRWESSLIQSSVVRDRGVALPASTLVISTNR